MVADETSKLFSLSEPVTQGPLAEDGLTGLNRCANQLAVCRHPDRHDNQIHLITGSQIGCIAESARHPVYLTGAGCRFR